MANYSTDDLKVLSETDLFSTMSKSLSLNSDYSSIYVKDHSWRYLAKTYFNNSKQLKSTISNVSIKDNSLNYYKNLPGAMPISMKQMLKAQNTNAPWLINILKKKFHRSRKNKKERVLSKEIDSSNTSMRLAEELLEKPISNDGTSGKWIVNEKDVVLPLIKNFDISTYGQYNVSRAMSSSTSPVPVSTDDSLHVRHYHYNFQTLTTPTASSSSFFADNPPQVSSIVIEETQQKISNDEDTPVDFTSIASMVKTYYTTSRQHIDSHNIQEMKETPSVSSPSVPEPIIEDVHLASGNSTTQTTSKRAKSASAARSRRTVGSSPTKRGKGQSESTKKKKSKHYQERLLSPEEIELREALRIIDLDNIGFFPPSELHKVLKEIGIKSHDIEKIERCLPIDEDGHYSIDNLIKLFLDTK